MPWRSARARSYPCSFPAGSNTRKSAVSGRSVIRSARERLSAIAIAAARRSSDGLVRSLLHHVDVGR